MPQDYSQLFDQAGQQYNVDPGLLASIAQTESSGNPNAVGPQTPYGQAQGLMQIIPPTAKALGVDDPTDPVQAINGAAKLLRQNLDKYGNVEDAVRAYHGGTNTDNWGPKTEDYLSKVTQNYKPVSPLGAGVQIADSGQSVTDAQVDAPAKTISVKLPNGKVVQNVPADMTKEDLMDRLEAGGIDYNAPAAPAEAPSFTGDVANSLAQDVSDYTQGKSNALESLVRGVGGVAGAGMNAVGRAVSSAVPQSAADAVKSGAQAVANGIDSVVPSVGNFLSGTTDAVKTAAQNNPRAAADLGALANIAGATSLAGDIGAGVAGVGNMAKNAVTPAVADSVKSVADLAAKHNIPLGLDQISDSKARQALTSVSARVPLSGGDQLGTAQRQAFTDAVKKSAGMDVATPDLNEAYDTALTKVGDKFDNAVSGTRVTFDNDAINHLAQISQDANDFLDPGLAKVVSTNVDKIANGLDNSGTIAGEKLNSIRSQLAKNSKNSGTATPYLNELMGEILDAGAAADPDKAEVLNQARDQYKHLMTIQPLVAKAETDQISPAALKQAVINGYGTRSVARGNAGDLGELAKVGSLIKSKIGDSGTFDRSQAAATLSAPAAVWAGGLPAVGAIASGVGAARGYQAYNASQGLVKSALNGTKAGNGLRTPYATLYSASRGSNQ